MLASCLLKRARAVLVTSATKVGRVSRGAYVIPIARDARRIGDGSGLRVLRCLLRACRRGRAPFPLLEMLVTSATKVGRVSRGAYVVPIARDARRIGNEVGCAC